VRNYHFYFSYTPYHIDKIKNTIAFSTLSNRYSYWVDKRKKKCNVLPGYWTDLGWAINIEHLFQAIIVLTIFKSDNWLTMILVCRY